MNLPFLYATSTLAYIIKTGFTINTLIELAATSTCIYTIKLIYQTIKSKSYLVKISIYLLFFTTTTTSIFGITETLTGSPLEESNPYAFGLAFYTSSIAYLIHQGKFQSKISPLLVSNPLLLITGPILTFIKRDIKKFSRRIEYYIPFIIIGFFYHQVIATPLINTFPLINKTDIISTVIFGIIFEIFVYANFCGISLIIYGIFGILGYKIPLNFKQPFSSRNLIEFWKGWHISLSTVLKALFYNPLKKILPTSISILMVYFFSAMWHGVTFNFLLWGGLHGCSYIFTLFMIRKKIRYIPTLIMLTSLTLGRILFSDSDTERIIEKLHFIFVDLDTLSFFYGMHSRTKLALFLGFGIVFIEFILKDKRYIRKRNYKYLRVPSSLLILTTITILTIDSSGVDFAVYGQR